MGILNRKLRFAAQPDGTPTDTESATDKTGGTKADPTVEFTLEQYATILVVLDLEDNATPEDVVAAITKLAEDAVKTTQEQQDESAKIAASLSRSADSVRIDMNAWQDMQHAIERGVSVQQQSHRLEAEQVVDQAIRLGKASPGRREHWIKAYHQDKRDTTSRLSRADEIPTIEMGYSKNSLEEPKPNGWVR